MLLRSYQEAARVAFWNYIREKDGNPCIVLPTGAGKGVIIAQLALDVLAWGGRILVLTHSKELIKQLADHLANVAGVYSAGLKRRDTSHPVLIAGIQSVYLKAAELGAFDVILVDECDLIPLEGEGRYRTFLADAKVVNPRVRIGGLTATAFRLDDGPICTPTAILNEICYEARLPDLIREGWLCPLRGKAAASKANTAGLHIRAGEFVSDECENLFLADEVLKPNVTEILEKTADRRSVLIFCSGIAHAEAVQREIIARGHICRMVSGETPDIRRDDIIRGFKAGEYKFLTNCDILTVGFDSPRIDAVCLLRATMSARLLVQMAGRGFRPHPEKTSCLLLDFGGNIARHGPLDQITIPKGKTKGEGPPPGKECPTCHEVVGLAARTCPDCGYEFPPPEPKGKLSPRASGKSILSTETCPPVWQKVQAVRFLPHRKKNSPEGHPLTLKVSYQVGWNQWVNEWVCVEHGMGFAREKARQWWQQRSAVPCPTTVEEAIKLAEGGCLAETLEILVAEEDGYPRPKQYKLGPVPPLGDAAEEAPRRYAEPVETADVPF